MAQVLTLWKQNHFLLTFVLAKTYGTHMRSFHVLWFHVLSVGSLLALLIKLVPIIEVWVPWYHFTQQAPIGSSYRSPKSTAETRKPKHGQHRQQSNHKQDVDFLCVRCQYMPCSKHSI